VSNEKFPRLSKKEKCFQEVSHSKMV